MKMLKKVKVILNYLTDRKILIGIGIGIIIGVVFMFGYKYENSMSDAEIQKKARDMGMIMKDEAKSIFKGDEKTND